MAHPLLSSDVYLRVGGRAALTQLMDPQGTGTWDAATLDTALGDAWNYVIAAVGVQAEVVGFTDAELRDKFPQLITVAAQKALRFGWSAGSGGQACPQGIIDLDVLAEQQLQMLAERRRKHGKAGFSPNPAQVITQIDNNPNFDRMTLRGFRSTGGLT